MRWLYFDPSIPSEATAHRKVLSKIDEWWLEFGSKSDDLLDLFTNRSEWDLPAWMHRHLHAISEDLMWEFGPAVSGKGHRLVITPEVNRHLRPMVDTLLDRAPRFTGWEFYSYRQPDDVEVAHHGVAARTGGNLSGTRATAAIGQNNRIDVCFYSAKTRGLRDEQALHNAFVATETLLGEELMDKWVGNISPRSTREPTRFTRLLGRARRAIPGLLPLERLKPTVDALVSAIQDQLPDKPLCALHPESDPREWKTDGVVVQLEPTAADDYPQRQDLVVASGSYEGLWRALHEDPCFYSERYSRHRECFCYLKLDGAQGLEEEKFPDRNSIETALDEALVPAALGCVIGGGTGLRYSYIDLALVNVDAAVPLIRSRLRAGNVSRRTWLLFFDATLAHEWIGVYDDSPAPPEPPSD